MSKSFYFILLDKSQQKQPLLIIIISINMSKFIFVTGGVVSGIGKGITTASIGLILKQAGFRVDVIKFDPYLNIDPGTLNPYEHGEVYVLNDGSETDLDLGHYERFLDTNLSKISTVTGGKIYNAILNRERDGYYLGKNVTLIPNVTDYIQECFAKETDILDENHIRLIEIGGSSGDLEGEVFFEGFRQFRLTNHNSILHIHLCYVPYLKSSREYKTKPLQNSVRELMSKGIQPDVLIARYYPENGEHLGKETLAKIALFSNLKADQVITLPDLESIYSVPIFLQNTHMKANLEKFTEKKLDVELPLFFNKILSPTSEKEIKIGIIAKYPKLFDAYLSLIESLKIAGVKKDVSIKPIFIDAEKIEEGYADKGLADKEIQKLKEVSGIIIPGGFGKRGLNGKIVAVNFARKSKIPFLGICLGLQMAVVEFAKNECELKAISSEMVEDRVDLEGKDVVIDLMEGQIEITRKGGTMRLGEYECQIEPDTLAFELFGKTKIKERHRHRLEVQSKFIPILEQKGMKICGKHFYQNRLGEKDYLVEMVELSKSQHPFFIATQSHPELLSRPDKPHPLFLGLIEAVLENTN
jgi:CTP synthase